MRLVRNFHVFAWLVAVALYIRSGTLPDYYAIHHDLPVDPWMDALKFSVISAFECAVLVLLIRPWSFSRSWGRLLVALAVFAPWLVLSMLVLMHAPPVVVAHALWVLLVVVGLVVAVPIALLTRQKT